uniref:Uncharacterized protein n=1 Tax=Arundo donax TaxID=35708 RepID=A0A0A9EU39_ARUDO
MEHSALPYVLFTHATKPIHMQSTCIYMFRAYLHLYHVDNRSCINIVTSHSSFNRYASMYIF